jgi:hypothetical protein
MSGGGMADQRGERSAPNPGGAYWICVERGHGSDGASYGDSRHIWSICQWCGTHWRTETTSRVVQKPYTQPANTTPLGDVGEEGTPTSLPSADFESRAHVTSARHDQTTP